MNLLLGQFASPIDDAARDLVFACLRPLRACGYPVGATNVQITGSTSVTIDIERSDAVMLSLVDRILLRAVADYQRRYQEEAKHMSQAALLDGAWRALTVVRANGHAHGLYELRLDGREVALHVGRWDAVLLEQCDAFLCALYRKSWWCFNDALAEGRDAVAPRLAPDVERAA